MKKQITIRDVDKQRLIQVPICGLDTWNMFTQKHEDPVNIFCQNPATDYVYDLSGNRLRGRVCKYHAEQTQRMIDGVNNSITRILSIPLKAK
jgi:hypothetical protein